MFPPRRRCLNGICHWRPRWVPVSAACWHRRQRWRNSEVRSKRTAGPVLGKILSTKNKNPIRPPSCFSRLTSQLTNLSLTKEVLGGMTHVGLVTCLHDSFERVQRMTNHQSEWTFKGRLSRTIDLQSTQLVHSTYLRRGQLWSRSSFSLGWFADTNTWFTCSERRKSFTHA